MKLRWFKNLASTRDFLFSLALVSGQVVALSTLASCGWFASTDGFEQYKGKLPDKSFVVLDDKDKKVTFKEGFSKDNYPRPVQIVDVKSPLDKTYMESAFASLAVLADRFDIDLQNPIPRIDESQSLDFLYNAAFRRGYRVFVLPSYLHGITFKQYYLKNKAAFEKEKDFLFVGVDYKFDKDLVKPGHSVTLNFKTEESSFVVGYAAARYIAERYSDPDERVMSAFAGVPYRGATDYTFGFLEGIKY